MQGDRIVLEEHHRRTGKALTSLLLPYIRKSEERYTIAVAGESGSGKSETAHAIADSLKQEDVQSIILQQDDYFVYPPKTNDQARREDINWVGPQEVHLGLMETNLVQFKQGEPVLEKPLVIYKENRIISESIPTEGVQVAIAEGTYTTLLDNIDAHIFIDRNYQDTRMHREKRRRDDSELDPFIEEVLAIEHNIISSSKQRANIIINKDYSVSAVDF